MYWWIEVRERPGRVLASGSLHCSPVSCLVWSIKHYEANTNEKLQIPFCSGSVDPSLSFPRSYIRYFSKRPECKGYWHRLAVSQIPAKSGSGAGSHSEFRTIWYRWRRTDGGTADPGIAAGQSSANRGAKKNDSHPTYTPPLPPPQPLPCRTP